MPRVWRLDTRCSHGGTQMDGSLTHAWCEMRCCRHLWWNRLVQQMLRNADDASARTWEALPMMLLHGELSLQEVLKTARTPTE